MRGGWLRVVGKYPSWEMQEVVSCVRLATSGSLILLSVGLNMAHMHGIPLHVSGWEVHAATREEGESSPCWVITSGTLFCSQDAL